MSNRRLLSALMAFGSLFMSMAADAQVTSTTETSTLLANPRLSPEARQAIQQRIDAVHAKFRESHAGLSPEQFGVQCCQIMQIPAVTFQSEGEPWQHAGQGYLYPSSTAEVWAPILLPSGVEIFFLDLYYHDLHADENIRARLWAFSGGGHTGAPSEVLLGSTESSGSPGNWYASAPLTHTVNNNVAFDPDAAQLAVSIDVNVAGSSLRFKAVDLWWMRQVSPAPAAATFSDVATNHQFFQFVEALAAAGITVGYPDGRFGVDDSITRGQMAVFLSKALGLYWPH